jgi:hypothetical protein
MYSVLSTWLGCTSSHLTLVLAPDKSDCACTARSHRLVIPATTSLGRSE